MLVKRFYLNLVLRMILILATMTFQAFAIVDMVEGQLMFTFIVLSGVLILQVVLLFHYLRRTNRNLTKFVLAIANEDFSLKFAKEKGKTPHKELNQAFNKIIEQYQSVYMEKESQSFLMQHLVKEIPAGIMVVNQEGDLIVKNHTMERFLKLEDGQPGFYEKILRADKPGANTYKLSASGEQLILSVTINEFPLLNKIHRIILVQDISKEVDAGEVDAIQRLLRILTHEIMNSLAPVQSLTETITMLMTDAEGRPREQESMSQSKFNDILESVQAIQERTGGLDHFVNRFRTLTRLPETLETKAVAIKDLFGSVSNIMHTQLMEVKLVLEVEHEEMKIEADSALMEQVLINLVTNSLTAMSATKHPCLILKAFHRNAHILIQVQDNGSGIPEEKLEDIFMPFYSTKEKASGIGLSFVKQVLLLHNANIQVHSSLGKGSTFSMRFMETV
jgi:signal transduction histidine kinase